MANTSTTSTTAAPQHEDAPAEDKQKNQTAASADPVVGFSTSAQASTGEVVKVPKTPEEIAKQGTALGIAGDFVTGGFNDPFSRPSSNPNTAVPGTRLWAMDSDHTTNNRGGFDPLKPDCTVSER